MESIRISGGFVLALSLLILLDSRGWIALLLLAAAVHELGHIVAIYACKGKITAFEAGICGCKIIYITQCSSYGADIFMAAAGPIANAVGAVAALCIGKTQDIYYFVGCNAILFLLNILPALPLDGGRILFALIAKYKGICMAERVLSPLGALVGVATAVGFAAIFVMSDNNMAFLLSEIIILFAMCGKTALQNRCKRL